MLAAGGTPCISLAIHEAWRRPQEVLPAARPPPASRAAALVWVLSRFDSSIGGCIGRCCARTTPIQRSSHVVWPITIPRLWRSWPKP